LAPRRILFICVGKIRIDRYIYIDRDRETERELRLFPKKCLPSSCSNEEAVETQTGGHGKSSGRMKGTEVGVG
jgi:hypothetical protein